MVNDQIFIVPPTHVVRGRRVLIERACSSARIPRKVIANAVDHVLAAEGICDAMITIVLCDDALIRQINVEFLKHDWATDVITFPLRECPLEGEIYISVETAARQAVEYGISTRTELIRLAVHGTLHLLGYDDTTETNRLLMHSRQELYLEQILVRRHEHFSPRVISHRNGPVVQLDRTQVS